MNKLCVARKNIHIHIRYMFLRDFPKEGTIQIKYCRSKDQIVGIMTKSLKLEIFVRLRKLLVMCSVQKKLTEHHGARFRGGYVQIRKRWLKAQVTQTRLDVRIVALLDFLHVMNQSSSRLSPRLLVSRLSPRLLA